MAPNEARSGTRYVPSPEDTRHIQLPDSIMELREKLAKNAHEVWATKRLAEGWRFGPERSEQDKRHPCLVPYDDLPDSEKEYDRQMAIETLKVIMVLGYQIGRAPEGQRGLGR